MKVWAQHNQNSNYIFLFEQWTIKSIGNTRISLTYIEKGMCTRWSLKKEELYRVLMQLCGLVAEKLIIKIKFN